MSSRVFTGGGATAAAVGRAGRATQYVPLPSSHSVAPIQVSSLGDADIIGLSEVQLDAQAALVDQLEGIQSAVDDASKRLQKQLRRLRLPALRIRGPSGTRSSYQCVGGESFSATRIVMVEPAHASPAAPVAAANSQV